MKLINTPEILPALEELVNNAVDKVILITEDFQFDSSCRLYQLLMEKKEQGVDILLYLSADASHSFNLARALDLQPTVIDHLHVNIFLNNDQAIMSSLNLAGLQENNIELAYKTETEREYQQLYEFYIAHIDALVFNSYGKMMLDAEIMNETILDDYFNPVLKEFNNPVAHKEYHPLSTFIKSFGYTNGEKPVGHWFYWKENGFLKSIIVYDRHGNITEEINSKANNNDNHLYYGLINIIGGLYKASLKDINRKAELNKITGNQRITFFTHLQDTLNIRIPNCVLNNLDDVIDIVFELNGTKRKKKKFFFH